jgi:hypothetical protein
MKRTLALAVLLLALVFAAGAFAQETIDPAAAPTFAYVNLHANFTLDPYLLRVESAGTLDASALSADCAGFVPGVPDVVVNWSGATDQLSFFVYSDTDPVLLVVTPSGDIVCNDDFSLDTLNPVVSIATPEEGAYAVFVGTYAAERTAYGWLGITTQTAQGIDIANADLRPMLALAPSPTAAALILRSPDELQYTDTPIFGQSELAQGFVRLRVPASAAGTEAASGFDFGGATCAGTINLIPSYRFTYVGEAQPLFLFFNGENDASLIVRLPDGSFVCSGDADEGNLNPALLLEDAQEGDYTVWLGSTGPSDFALGVLVITEDPAEIPAILSPAR